MEPTTAPVKAAARNWPSMAMLMTPARSQSTPQRAPNAIGVARADGAAQQPHHRRRLPVDGVHQVAEDEDARRDPDQRDGASAGPVGEQQERRREAGEDRPRRASPATGSTRSGSSAMVWPAFIRKVAEPSAFGSSATAPSRPRGTGCRTTKRRSRRSCACGTAAVASGVIATVAVLTIPTPSPPASSRARRRP